MQVPGSLVGSGLALAMMVGGLEDCDDTRVCTLAGCGGGFSVTLLETTPPTVPTTYDIELVLDDVPFALQCTRSEDETTCPEFAGDKSYAISTAYFIGEDGTLDLDITIQRFVDGVTSGPDTVDIRVTVDGTLLADRHFEPEYELRENNGPGCGLCSDRVIEMVTVDPAQ